MKKKMGKLQMSELARELEDLKRQMAALREEIYELRRTPAIVYYPATGTANACDHIYPSPWFGVMPPKCLKCHQ
jgi:hypothetical protein